MWLSIKLFFALLSIVAAVPPIQFRDVKSDGPSGKLTLENRWGDVVGTATHIWKNGPVRKNTVFHTSRSGPLSQVYRDTLGARQHSCQPSDDSKCEPAVNSFGGVGEVQYRASDIVTNIVSRATQVQVACRCVDTECGKAVLIRPVNVYETLPDPASSAPVTPIRRTCLYEASGPGFTNCHTELLRMVRRPISQKPEFTHAGEAFKYEVTDGSTGANWIAEGQRGWTRDCLASEVDSLGTVRPQDIDDIQENSHSTPPGNGCKPPNEFVRYFQEEDPDAGEACYSTYEFASLGASHVASQQDEYATGHRPDSYMDPKPSLVSNTELALTCSAAGLGILFAGSLLWKQSKKTHITVLGFWTTLVMQILGYMLEALPLHVALGQEVRARDWESEFAFIDGSVALGEDALGLQASAEGAVLVLTAVVGTVRYFVTRVRLVAVFTALFDLFIIGIIVATALITRRVISRGTKRTAEVNGTNSLLGLLASPSRLQNRNRQEVRPQGIVWRANVMNSTGPQGREVHWIDGKPTTSLMSISIDESLSGNASGDLEAVSSDVGDLFGNNGAEHDNLVMQRWGMPHPRQSGNSEDESDTSNDSSTELSDESKGGDGDNNEKIE